MFLIGLRVILLFCGIFNRFYPCLSKIANHWLCLEHVFEMNLINTTQKIYSNMYASIV